MQFLNIEFFYKYISVSPQNIGIDFEPQSITGNIKGENIDKPIINLKKYAISLDNRYLKEYTIIKEETQTIIKIKT